MDGVVRSRQYQLLSDLDSSVSRNNGLVGLADEIPRGALAIKANRELVKGIGEHSAELDGYVEKYLRGWQFGRISRTALAVIKTAMYEILYMPDIPNAAAINDAVEISKEYDEPDTVSFINGVLVSFVREEIKEQ